jgi:hypothetical protein
MDPCVAAFHLQKGRSFWNVARAPASSSPSIARVLHALDPRGAHDALSLASFAAHRAHVGIEFTSTPALGSAML